MGLQSGCTRLQPRLHRVAGRRLAQRIRLELHVLVRRVAVRGARVHQSTQPRAPLRQRDHHRAAAPRDRAAAPRDRRGGTREVEEPPADGRAAGLRVSHAQLAPQRRRAVLALAQREPEAALRALHVRRHEARRVDLTEADVAVGVRRHLDGHTVRVEVGVRARVRGRVKVRVRVRVRHTLTATKSLRWLHAQPTKAPPPPPPVPPVPLYTCVAQPSVLHRCCASSQYRHSSVLAHAGLPASIRSSKEASLGWPTQLRSSSSPSSSGTVSSNGLGSPATLSSFPACVGR